MCLGVDVWYSESTLVCTTNNEEHAEKDRVFMLPVIHAMQE